MNSDTVKANQHYLNIINSSSALSTLALRANVYKVLSEIDFYQGNYLSAYQYLEQYKIADDSLKKASNTSLLTVMEMQMAHRDQQNKMEIAQQKMSLESHRKNTLIIILSGIVLIVILASCFFIRLQRTEALAIKLKKENLKKELDYKNREMASNVMALMKKNEILGNI